MRPILTRMLQKHVCFHGKFDYGAKERLTGMVEAQQGMVVEALDAAVDFLVLRDLASGKTIQKQVLSLNTKGAAVQVIDADAFEKLVAPTEAELLALIRGGKANADLFAKAVGSRSRPLHYHHQTFQPFVTFTAEKFEDLELDGFDFGLIGFEQCSFARSKLANAGFASARHCDFSNAAAVAAAFGDVDGSRFLKADLESASFQGSLASTDFTGAILFKASLSRSPFGPPAAQQLGTPGCVFAAASVRKAKFLNLSLKSPDFDGTNLSDSVFNLCNFTGASFRNANLERATFVGCGIPNADFSGANCARANFADSDLTDSRFDGADLAECNFRGATIEGVNVAKAKNYNPAATPAGTVGPALRELDALATQARRICLTFRIRANADEEGEEVGIDTARLKYGWALRIPPTLLAGRLPRQTSTTFSDSMLLLANMLMNRKVRFETLDIETTKSPKGGKELRELALKGISEAFAQPVPDEKDLATTTKAFREQIQEQKAIDHERREKAKAIVEKQQQTAKKTIAKQIAKEVGTVTDIATFLKAMELRADKAKIDKATKMLKAERFQLFNDVTETHLNGVVKSQTDPDLVYACRIESGGGYACCTQNLNICGGLRGSICKHLLVLIIGLVKAGELDPSTIDGWVAKTHDAKPELNKETMGEIFIRYKGAEAGEVDWRPTQTVPEDYYAL
jgi:uncharacterized protein YjbI with pentapeptide repeats